MTPEGDDHPGAGAGRSGRPLDLPEVHFFLFGLLVHYPWEFLQVPLFAGLADAPHWQAVKFCSAAALGDAGLTVLAYWVAAAMHGRAWVQASTKVALAPYLGTGLLATVALEWLNADVLGRWTYAQTMPTLPLLGTGLSPLAQWIFLPLLVLAIVRRQLRGAAT